MTFGDYASRLAGNPQLRPDRRIASWSVTSLHNKNKHDKEMTVSCTYVFCTTQQNPKVVRSCSDGNRMYDGLLLIRNFSNLLGFRQANQRMRVLP